jgi:hypothetical protein
MSVEVSEKRNIWVPDQGSNAAYTQATVSLL